MGAGREILIRNISLFTSISASRPKKNQTPWVYIVYSLAEDSEQKKTLQLVGQAAVFKFESKLNLSAGHLAIPH